MKTITITIDGPAGSGKGTTAQGVAQQLGYTYVDSGAMYRAITYHALQKNITEGGPVLEDLLAHIHLDIDTEGKVTLNGTSMGEELRTERINRYVSRIYARIQEVRDKVTTSCQRITSKGACVIDGRDAATVIAPQAELKIYLDCDPYERARRRALQWGDSSEERIQEIMNDILLPRDQADGHELEAARAIATAIDTTHLTIDQQIQEVCNLAQEIITR